MLEGMSGIYGPEVASLSAFSVGVQASASQKGVECLFRIGVLDLGMGLAIGLSF